MPQRKCDDFLNRLLTGIEAFQQLEKVKPHLKGIHRGKACSARSPSGEQHSEAHSPSPAHAAGMCADRELRWVVVGGRLGERARGSFWRLAVMSSLSPLDDFFGPFAFGLFVPPSPPSP